MKNIIIINSYFIVTYYYHLQKYQNVFTQNLQKYQNLYLRGFEKIPIFAQKHTILMPRPSFDQIASYDEFAKYYWYRDELIKICKSLNINASSTKIELMETIRLYFSGVMVEPKQQLPKPKPTATNLTLKTSLIECGFSFGPRFREFFETVTGVKPFKFNVDMVATVKKVKADNDVSFTLGDLLDVLRGKKVYAQYDKSMLQWNRFVKDFCADPATARFPDKIKTASILWAQVRNSTREKVYTTELLTEFGELIK